MMIFDLSNPRTVDEKVATIHGVKLINMDQIAELVEKNMRLRKKEVNSAEKIIQTEMRSVESMMKRMKAEPVIVSVFKSVDSIRERELRKALSMLGKKADAKEARIIEQLSYAIVEGILSTPMNYVRKEMEAGDMGNEELMKVVAKMFKYEDEKKRQ
jgi:glutamyl-tRNA reductase